MNYDEKEQIVSTLTEKFKNYSFVYVSDASGLTGDRDNKLRRLMHKNGIDMVVAKNTLIKKAMENSGKDFSGLFGSLKGFTALMFSEDVKAPAKTIKEFRQKTEKPSLKGAWIDSDVFLGDASIDALINLKSKNELIGEVIGLLQSPAQNVISGLKSGGAKLAGILKTLEERGE